MTTNAPVDKEVENKKILQNNQENIIKYTLKELKRIKDTALSTNTEPDLTTEPVVEPDLTDVTYRKKF